MAARFRLWQRLFLLIVAASGTTLAAAVFMQQWQFERGFVDYINRLNVQIVETGAGRLADHYRKEGNWDALRANRGLFDSVIGGQPMQPGPRNEPPPSKPGMGAGDPPPKGGPTRADDPPGPVPKSRDPGPGPSGSSPIRLMLVDANGVRVSGNRQVPDDSHRIPVMVDGKRVGEVLLAPVPTLQRGVDIDFARSQRQHALWIAFGMLAVSLIAAGLLARHLLVPVTALHAGTRLLAAGDFNVNIRSDRSDELGELARDFNQLARALSDSQAARRRWSADIAHELRTPLSILGGELQALLDGIRPVTPEALRSLIAEYQRIMSLVEDLYQLSLSDVGALEYRRRPMDLAAVLRASADLHSSQLTERGIELMLALPPDGACIDGDERRLMQLFTNLFTNAIRYTDSPGRIRVSVTSEGRDWRIDFEDTPPGVAPEHLPKLFDRLYRVEASRNRAAGGAGLGLSIAQSIVAAHDGRIEALPSSMGGLCVRIRLPAAPKTSATA